MKQNPSLGGASAFQTKSISDPRRNVIPSGRRRVNGASGMSSVKTDLVDHSAGVTGLKGRVNASTQNLGEGGTSFSTTRSVSSNEESMRRVRRMQNVNPP